MPVASGERPLDPGQAHHRPLGSRRPRCWAAVEDNGQVVFRYAAGQNPNGSLNDIAGVRNERGNVVGLMPHPEHAVDPLTRFDRRPEASSSRRPGRSQPPDRTVNHLSVSRPDEGVFAFYDGRVPGLPVRAGAQLG